MARKESHTTRQSSVPAPLPDDFKVIDGLCPAIENSLHQAGILTYEQLGNLSASSLSNFLPSLSGRRNLREAWLKQARHLAIERGRQSRRKPVQDLPLGSQQIIAVELRLNKRNRVQYMRVTHTRCDIEEHWVGWDETRLIRFLIEHTGLVTATTQPSRLLEQRIEPAADRQAPPLPAAPVSLAVDSTSVPVTPATTATTLGPTGELRVSDLMVLPGDTAVSQNTFCIGQAINVCFVVDLADVVRVPDAPLICTITIWAKKLGEETSQVVGGIRTTTWAADKVPCTLKVTIPTPGTYRLEVIAAVAQPGNDSISALNLVAVQTSRLLQIH